MSIVVVGLNHKSSPIQLIERLSIAPDDVGKALQHLLVREHVVEGIVLSTCNRVEAYAAVTRFHGGAQNLRNFFSEFCDIPPEEFSDHLYTYFDEGAVSHLFRVAAGLDSLIVGESEILGQVRSALALAEEEGTVGLELRRAFTQALRVGKRARSETTIGRNPVSVSSAAVELARRAFARQGRSTLDGKHVLVVGAGKMGRLAVQALVGAGATGTVVVNRSEERAHEVARAFGVVPRPLIQLPESLADADIVICSTTAPGLVLDRAVVARAMEKRPDRPLFIVDIAVPRDVDPAVAQVDGVVLRDIEDLRGVVETNLGGRIAEMGDVEDIIASEVERFVRWERAVEVAPIVARLVTRSEDMRTAELARARSALGEMTDAQWAAVEQLTNRIVSKLLHEPLNQSKRLANSSAGRLYVEALTELFELDDEPDS